MKNKTLFTLVVALALLASCIKDEGYELLATRNEVNDSTVVTAEGGYMEGISKMDTILRNSFETILSGSQIQQLNCYTTLHSEFKALNTTRNGIREVGYVYSHTNKTPVITDKQNCKVFTVSKDVSPTETEVSFDGTINGLDFNSTYYVRSYAICNGDGHGKNDSVIYSSRPLEYKTVLPEDVWFERSKAPADMPARKDVFQCNIGDDVYLYGGKSGTQRFNDLWKYDVANDTWQQLATFDKTVSVPHYALSVPARRSNGAMLAYPTPKAADILLFIIGGEVSDESYTSTIFYYSTKNQRFADLTDHPNAGESFVLHDDNGQTLYEYEYEKDENGNYKKDADGNRIIATDGKGNPKYLEKNGEKVPQTTSSTRNYIEPLPIFNVDPKNGQRSYKGLAGCVAFALEDASNKNMVKYFVAFGKNDLSSNGQKNISLAVYQYDPYYDWDRQGSDRDFEPWVNIAANKDKALEGLYQPVCVVCGDRVVVGTGESSKTNNVSKNFYTLAYSVAEQTLRMESMPAIGEGFKPRANAAAFYLNYTKEGGVTSYDRFYVGTGRSCKEDDFKEEPEQLLNDFWCYDFVTRKWSQKADCSNIVRQGAVGFAVKRADDVFVKDYKESNVRGMFSFGEGYVPEANAAEGEPYGYIPLNDNWEYIP